MRTDSRHIGYFKTLRLKQVGLALAALWIVVLVAALSATIYREIDGPSVRSTITENLQFSSTNSTLNKKLDSARNANDQLKLDLQRSRYDYADLQNQLDWLESHTSPAILNRISR